MLGFPQIPRHLFTLKELKIFDVFKNDYTELTKDLNNNYEVKAFSRDGKGDDFNKILLNNLERMRKQNEVVVQYGYMFWQRFFKKKPLTVHFDEEVLEKADEIGDIAGKEREVSRSIVSITNAHRRRVIRKLFRSGKFEKLRKNVPVIEDETIYDCDWRCLKVFQKINPRPSKNPTFFSQGYKEEIVNFGATLDLVGEFIDGNSSTIDVAEKLLYIPLTGVEASLIRDFLPNDTRPYNLEVGLISAKIWIFTLCYTRLMENYKMTPQDSNKILERYMSFIVDINRTVEEALDFGEIHRKFAKEIISIIIKIEVVIDRKVDSDSSIEKVAQQGEALKLDKEYNLENKMIAIRAAGKKEWGNFVDHSYEFRFGAIHDLLVESQAVLYRIRTQLKFLTEDVENRRFDFSDPNFVDLFSLIVEIIYYFDRSKETSKDHWENLQNIVGAMIKDVRNFIMKGFRLVRKLMEVRDMAQLCTEKLNAVSNFRVFYLRHRPKGLNSSSLFSCFNNKKQVMYDPEDFSRVSYPSSLSKNFIENNKLEYLVIKKGDLPTNVEKAQKVEEELGAKVIKEPEIKPILREITEAEESAREAKFDREIIERIKELKEQENADIEVKENRKESESKESRSESNGKEGRKESESKENRRGSEGLNISSILKKIMTPHGSAKDSITDDQGELKESQDKNKDGSSEK